MNEKDYLMHYGRKGMKWYQNIYTNADGTPTKRGQKRIQKIEKFRDDLIKKTQQEYQDNYRLSNDSGYPQHMRSAFLKLADAGRYSVDKMKDVKVSAMTTKKELKQLKSDFEEKQYNQYIVGYNNDGSVVLLNPYMSKQNKKI